MNWLKSTASGKKITAVGHQFESCYHGKRKQWFVMVAAAQRLCASLPTFGNRFKILSLLKKLKARASFVLDVAFSSPSMNASRMDKMVTRNVVMVRKSQRARLNIQMKVVGGHSRKKFKFRIHLMDRELFFQRRAFSRKQAFCHFSGLSECNREGL